MPAKNNFDQSYPSRLLDMGIKLLEPFEGAKIHHLMKCGTCGNEWSATPLSKLQAKKKYPLSNGCDLCRRTREDQKYETTRQEVYRKLAESNLIVLTPGYKGQRKNIYEKILVKNTQCGHEFDICIGNFLYRESHTDCIICGIAMRSAQLTQTSLDRHNKWAENATEWQLYKYSAENKTARTYRANKAIINPTNLMRGKAGIDGAYHLDHIISRRYCFDNGIPFELCGHIDNLRMIPWLENVKKGKHIVTDIPGIFDDYILSPSIVDWEEDDTEEELCMYAEIEEELEKESV